MKLQFWIPLLLCLFGTETFAQSNFYGGQTVYVWSKGGLVLRNHPSKKGSKIETLPYGTKLRVSDNNQSDSASPDSVLVIPASEFDDQINSAYYLKGYWIFVNTGRDSGYVFGAYLSEMQPFKAPVSEEYYGSIGDWIGQNSAVLDSQEIKPKWGEGYSKVYKNHAVEYSHYGEGGGSTRYTFQYGMDFQDGFLLLNYFVNLHFSKEELMEAEYIGFQSDVDTFYFESLGLRGGIGWTIRIVFENGLLIIEEGGGC